MRTVWLGAVLVGGGAVAWAQAPGNPNTPNPQGQCTYTVTASDGQTVTGTKACSGQAIDPNTPLSKRLPYPGDPAPDEAPLGKETTPVVPNVPSVPPPPESGSNAGGMKDAGSSGESSSSSSSSSSSDKASTAAEGPPPDPNDVNSDTPVAPKRNLHRKPAFSMANQPVEEQEAEDVKIAKFYMNDGNWRGAYGRAADAVKLVDDDPAAHLALANAARKLGKMDEALKEYKRTLALDPIPKDRKEAERSLKEMAGEG